MIACLSANKTILIGVAAMIYGVFVGLGYGRSGG
jgi:hypothetical protein